MDLPPRKFATSAHKAWADRDTLDYIRECYPLKPNGTSKRRSTALAIYLVLVDCAGRFADKGSETFWASINTIAQSVGKSYNTTKRYLDEFVRVGILAKKHERLGKRYKPNTWVLLVYSKMLRAMLARTQYYGGSKTSRPTTIVGHPSPQDSELPSTHNNE